MAAGIVEKANSFWGTDMLHRRFTAMFVTGNVLATLPAAAFAAAISQPAEVAQSTAVAQDPSASPQAGVSSGDIVVTANKRKESLDRVPLAVTAISGEMAAAKGITNIASLQESVAGLQFPKAFDGATPTIRGIGPVESVVAMYVDDVYIAQPAATMFDFNKISQVEVLKGPQGTIYGRNAMAGVVDVHTPDPSHNTSADVSLGYGNYDTFSGQGYFTTGLADTLAADVAVTGSHQGDGWGSRHFGS